MSEGQKNALPRRTDAADAPSRAIPLHPLRRIATRPDEALLLVLETALLEPDRLARRRAVRHMLDAGVTWEEIVDLYIPAAARRLGQLWCEDEVSFADVTIGSARLQSMLRDAAPAWAAELRDDPRAPNMLLIVRQDDFHTLGAMVAAEQLRRLGVSVRLLLGQADTAVQLFLAGRHFDAVLISAASAVGLDPLRDLVKYIRMVLTPGTPIVIGGSILDTDRDVRACTGADHVTSDPLEVLRLCGLRISHRDGVPSTVGG